MALLPADRVIAARHAWLSPLPPEGASAIVHGGDISHRRGDGCRARRSGIDLRARGIVDRVVAELDQRRHEPAPFSRRMGAVLAQELSVLLSRPAGERLARRASRYAFGP